MDDQRLDGITTLRGWEIRERQLIGLIKGLLDVLDRVLPELPERVREGSHINRQLRRARNVLKGLRT